MLIDNMEVSNRFLFPCFYNFMYYYYLFFFFWFSFRFIWLLAAFVAFELNKCHAFKPHYIIITIKGHVVCGFRSCQYLRRCVDGSSYTLCIRMAQFHIVSKKDISYHIFLLIFFLFSFSTMNSECWTFFQIFKINMESALMIN